MHDQVSQKSPKVSPYFLAFMSPLLTSTSSIPLSPYGIFHGSLFQYSSSPSLVAFESTPTASQPPHRNKCILLGGLSDGLLPVPYTKPLEVACHSAGWSLVQPLLSSSYTGFGHGSLDQDVRELNLLLRYLQSHHDAQRFAIVGHSTGCQMAVHFIRQGQEDLVHLTQAVVLQAPVSDREYPLFHDPTSLQHHLHLAQSMIDCHRGEEMMPRSSFWAPITASRYISLHSVGGTDDYFSSDYTDTQLQQRLGHVGRVGKRTGLNVLVAVSDQDEYSPPSVDIPSWLQRLCQAINLDHEDVDTTSIHRVAQPLLLHQANHNLSMGNVDHFISEVQHLLQLKRLSTTMEDSKQTLL